MPYVDDGSVRTLWLCERCGKVTDGGPHECEPTCTECPAPDAPDDTRECEAADLYVRLAELIDERDAANAKRQRAEEWAARWKRMAKRYQTRLAIAEMPYNQRGRAHLELQLPPIRSNSL